MPEKLSQQSDLWLRNKTWDLALIIFSGALFVVPHFLFNSLNFSAMVVGVTVAILVGGPHLYSTFTRVAMDKRFTQRYPAGLIFLVCLLIPVGVVYMLVTNTVLMFTIFFFWASLHVLHQLYYILQLYNRKQPAPPPVFRSIAEFCLIFTSLYPMAILKLTSDQFYIGPNLLLFPRFLKGPTLPVLIWTVFGLSLLAFIFFSLRDWFTQKRIFPKTYLLTATVIVLFLAPTFPDLDVAFQGVNIWHSFQYLALTWFITRQKEQMDGLREKPVITMIKKHKGLNFYLFNVGLTLPAGVLVVIVHSVTSLTWQISYWSVIFSSLLVHYFLDHLLFTEFSIVPRRHPEPALV